MSSTLEFRRPTQGSPAHQSTRPKRLLGNKLQEIARRSPADLAAFDTLADFVLARLDDHDNRAARKRLIY